MSAFCQDFSNFNMVTLSTAEFARPANPDRLTRLQIPRRVSLEINNKYGKSFYEGHLISNKK